MKNFICPALGRIASLSIPLLLAQAAAAQSVTTIKLNPSSITGGATTTGTVVLSAPAPRGGVMVLLSANSENVTIPPSITVPAGSTQQTFTVNSTAVLSVTTATLTATFGSSTASASLILRGIGLDLTAPWPKFHGDIRNTGQTQYDYAGADWTTALGSTVTASSPAAGADGTVYLGADDAKLYALDPSLGTVKWTFPTGAAVRSSPVVTANNTVFVGSNDSYVYAVNGIKGTLIWKFKTGSSVQSTPALGADGYVYVGSSDGYLYKLDQQSGAVAWKFKTQGPVVSSPTITTDGTVCFGSNDNALYAVNSVTGAKLWSFTAGGAISGCPAIAHGNVYFGSADGNVYGLTLSSGTKVWNAKIGDLVTGSPAIGGSGNVIVGAKVNGTPQATGVILKLDGGSGATVWQTATKTPIQSSPCIDLDHNIYVVTDGGVLTELYTAYGTVENQITIGTGVKSAPLVSTPGHVIVSATSKACTKKTVPQPIPVIFQSTAVYQQTGVNAVKPVSASALLITNDTGSVKTGTQNGTGVTPTGSTISLSVVSSDAWWVWLPVASEKDIDAALPTGKYAFTFPGAESTYYSNVVLKAHTFSRNTPRISNFAALQSMSASAGITLQFPALQSPSADCWTSPLVQVLDANGNQIFFGDVWGTSNTSQTIPAGLLTAGKPYTLTLWYVSRAPSNYQGWNPSVSSYYEFSRQTFIKFVPKA